MRPSRQLGFWAGAFVVAAVLLFALRAILLPFVAGMAIAYLLDPVADRLERWKLSRTLATTIITAAFIVVLVAAIVLLLPLLQSQVLSLVAALPGYAESLRGLLESALTDLQARLPAEQMEALRQAATQLSGTIARQVGGFVGSVVTGGLFLINLLSLLFITPIVTFYLLRDWDRMMAKLNDLLPLHYADTVREQLALIDRRLAGFVRGQMIVAGILGSFYAIALSLAGLEFGLVIGLAAGAISFIPFVGSVSGFVVSVALALVQFDTWPPVAIVAGIFGVGQLVEGNFLTPKLVGDKVGLHPVWVIFALLAGGSLLGLVGMLLAVPLAAVIGVLVAFAITRYRGSVLYHGAGDIRALPPAGDDGEDTDEGKDAGA